MSHALPEEARKSWDYAISDKIVYGSECLYPNLETTARAVDWLPKYDLGHYWIELQIVFLGQRNGYFCCIVEIAPGPFGDSGDTELQIGGVYRENHVLVGNAEFIENPEGMILESRASVIRLKRFDHGCGCGKNVLHCVTEPPGRIRGIPANRERSVGVRPLDMQQGKLPSE